MAEIIGWHHLGGTAPPSQLHRGLSLVAIISLFIGTRAAWTLALTTSPFVMATLSVCYLSLLVMAAVALAVRTERGLVLLDVLILATACAMVLGAVVVDHRPSDEGTLVAQAARTLLGGGEIYGVAWPQLFTEEHIPLTPLMGGGTAYTFGYPPLAVLLTAPALFLTSFPGAASFVTTLALLAGAVTLWVMLPIAWRSGATAVMLGFPFLPNYARLGYPAIIAMALLIPVVVRWPTIGAGDRFRRSDVLRAVCLGLACATQQLAWFVTPFLLVGLFAVRRGEMPAGRATRRVGTFVVVAAATFLAINLPFIVRNAPAWTDGVLLVLTQHAIPHGQGLIDVSFYLTDGSAALDFYSYATLLLGAGLLACTVIWMRRLGAALTVIPWLVFYFSVRSQDGYFLIMTPLWLAAAATAPPAAFRNAWEPRLGSFARPRFAALPGARWIRGTPGRVGLGAVLLAPSLLCAGLAVTTDEPLELAIVSTTSHGAQAHGLWQLQVDVVNEARVPLAPNFTISNGQGVTPFWTASGGPPILAPHQHATYLLTAPVATGYDPGANGFLFLRALTDRPMTVSTVRIPIK